MLVRKLKNFKCIFNKRDDICKTISNMEMFDFLVDIVAKDNFIEPYINSNDGKLNVYFEDKKW